MIDLATYPWLAFAVAFVAAYAVGAIWYSPLLFGRAWQTAIGLSMEDLGSPSRAMAVSAVMWLIASFCFGLLSQWTGAESIGALIGLGALLWIGFAMLPICMGTIFGARALSLIWIDGGYILVGFIVFALVFGLLG